MIADKMVSLKEAERQHFHKTIVELTMRKGWSAADLARFSGMSRDNTSRYLRGDSVPGAKQLQQLARCFGVDPSVLMPGLSGFLNLEPQDEFKLEPSHVKGNMLLTTHMHLPVDVALEIAKILNKHLSVS